MELTSFRTPAKRVRPMVRWWWPGLDVEKAELLREIADLDAAGVGGAEIQPFMIGQPKDLKSRDLGRFKRSHRFMQDFHYEMMKAVVDEAKSRGMFVDITICSAWPAGGTHIPVERSLKTLLFGTAKVRGGRVFRGKVPGLKVPRQYFVMGKLFEMMMGSGAIEYIPEDKTLAKVLAGRVVAEGSKRKFTSWRVKESTLLDPGSIVDLTNEVDKNGTLNWDVPKGDWQLFAVYEGSAGAKPLVSSTDGGEALPLVVDHFNADDVRFHAESFIGTAKKWFGDEFGRTFRAVFTDSIELVTPMHWTDAFQAEFQARRGYDITRYLPICYVPSRDNGFYTYGNEVGAPNFDLDSEDGLRIRYDFQRTLAELFVENYVRNAGAWCESNALAHRMQGYGFRADPLSMLGYAHIPETEQFYGGGCLNFMKLAGAASTLYERPVVCSETMVFSGRAYMTTPQKWRVALDRLYESGVNQAIYHGFPYRHPEYTHPGFQPFSSPYIAMGFSGDFSRDNPLLFDAAPRMNDYAARIQNVMQQSRTRTSVAIFYQLFDYPNGYYVEEELVQGHLDEADVPLQSPSAMMSIVTPSGTDVTGERKWIQDTAKLGQELVAEGYYPLYVNEDRLLKAARVEDGKLLIGDALFEILILYREEVLPLEVAGKLDEIRQGGVPVLFFGCKPHRVPGYFDHDNRDATLAGVMDRFDSQVTATHGDLISKIGRLGVRREVIFRKPIPHVGFIHKTDRDRDADYYLLRNYRESEKSVSVTLPVKGKHPLLLDAWTGNVGRLEEYEVREHGIDITVKLPGYCSCLLALESVEVAGEHEATAFLPLRNEMDHIIEIRGFAVESKARLVDGSWNTRKAQIETPVDLREISGFGHVSSPLEYSASFEMTDRSEARRYFLQFGRVCEKARIVLNGVECGELLVMPWRVEITDALKAGFNELTVVVTPTLRNRLVGYSKKSRDYKQYKNTPTMAAGLIGAVEVLSL